MGEVFNCGDDERLTIRQVAEIITDELQHDWELIGMPADLAVPAREAVRLATRWLVENPPEPGGYEESALQDPFDYAAEDRLVAWWKAAVADPPELGYDREPGYGKSYAGPGTRYVRPDTRI